MTFSDADVCRTCLSLADNQKVRLYSLCVVDSKNVDLKHKLKACVPELKVIFAMSEPRICKSCVDALHTAYEFRQMCLQTEQKVASRYLEVSKESDIFDIDDDRCSPGALPIQTIYVNDIKVEPLDCDVLSVCAPEYLLDDDSSLIDTESDCGKLNHWNPVTDQYLIEKACREIPFLAKRNFQPKHLSCSVTLAHLRIDNIAFNESDCEELLIPNSYENITDGENNQPVDNEVLLFPTSREDISHDNEPLKNSEDLLIAKSYEDIYIHESVSIPSDSRFSKKSRVKAVCIECGRSFKNEYGLRLHIGRKHKSWYRASNKYRCKRCNKEFIEYFHLKQHIMTAHASNSNNRVKYRQLCPPTTSTNLKIKDASQKNLISSKSVHNVEPQQVFECTSCDQPFPTRELLLQHLDTHKKRPPSLTISEDVFESMTKLLSSKIDDVNEKEVVNEINGNRNPTFQACDSLKNKYGYNFTPNMFDCYVPLERFDTSKLLASKTSICKKESRSAPISDMPILTPEYNQQPSKPYKRMPILKAVTEQKYCKIRIGKRRYEHKVKRITRQTVAQKMLNRKQKKLGRKSSLMLELSCSKTANPARDVLHTVGPNNATIKLEGAVAVFPENKTKSLQEQKSSKTNKLKKKLLPSLEVAGELSAMFECMRLFQSPPDNEKNKNTQHLKHTTDMLIQRLTEDKVIVNCDIPTNDADDDLLEPPDFVQETTPPNQDKNDQELSLQNNLIENSTDNENVLQSIYEQECQNEDAVQNKTFQNTAHVENPPSMEEVAPANVDQVLTTAISSPNADSFTGAEKFVDITNNPELTLQDQFLEARNSPRFSNNEQMSKAGAQEVMENIGYQRLSKQEMFSSTNTIKGSVDDHSLNLTTDIADHKELQKPLCDQELINQQTNFVSPSRNERDNPTVEQTVCNQFLNEERTKVLGSQLQSRGSNQDIRINAKVHMEALDDDELLSPTLRQNLDALCEKLDDYENDLKEDCGSSLQDTDTLDSYLENINGNTHKESSNLLDTSEQMIFAEKEVGQAGEATISLHEDIFRTASRASVEDSQHSNVTEEELSHTTDESQGTTELISTSALLEEKPEHHQNLRSADETEDINKKSENSVLPTKGVLGHISMVATKNNCVALTLQHVVSTTVEKCFESFGGDLNVSPSHNNSDKSVIVQEEAQNDIVDDKIASIPSLQVVSEIGSSVCETPSTSISEAGYIISNRKKYAKANVGRKGKFTFVSNITSSAKKEICRSAKSYSLTATSTSLKGPENEKSTTLLDVVTTPERNINPVNGSSDVVLIQSTQSSDASNVSPKRYIPTSKALNRNIKKMSRKRRNTKKFLTYRKYIDMNGRKRQCCKARNKLVEVGEQNPVAINVCHSQERNAETIEEKDIHCAIDDKNADTPDESISDKILVSKQNGEVEHNHCSPKIRVKAFAAMQQDTNKGILMSSDNCSTASEAIQDEYEFDLPSINLEEKVQNLNNKKQFCDLCNKPLPHYVSLESHMVIHTCMFCKMKVIRGNLQKHLTRAHHVSMEKNRQRYQYKIGGAAAPIITKPNRIARTPAPVIIKPNMKHSCTLCRKSLSPNVNKENHMKGHICSYCGQTFMKNDLKQHLFDVHNSSSDENLRRHYSKEGTCLNTTINLEPLADDDVIPELPTSSVEEIHCKMCEERFSHHDFTNHMKCHLCSYCGLELRKTQLHKHLKQVHDASPEDNMRRHRCGNTSSLTAAIKTEPVEQDVSSCADDSDVEIIEIEQIKHRIQSIATQITEIKKYQCNHCEIAFVAKAQIKTHLKLSHLDIKPSKRSYMKIKTEKK